MKSYGIHTALFAPPEPSLPEKYLGLFSLGMLGGLSGSIVFLYKYGILRRFFSALTDIDLVKIIEIDASVIVGVLILLTLSAGDNNLPFVKDPMQIWISTMLIIVPFSVSTIFVMAKFKTLGKAFMLVGFIFLILIIALLVIQGLTSRIRL